MSAGGSQGWETAEVSSSPASHGRGDALHRIPCQMVTQAFLACLQRWEGRPSPSEKASSIDLLVAKF